MSNIYKELSYIFSMGKSLDFMLSGVLALAGSAGCAQIQVPQQQTQVQREITSHKLEDLCDTETETVKRLNLHVYIEPHKDIWDYHEYRNEIFSYVTAFFKKYNVDCNIEFHNKPLERAYLGCNETGVEILASDDRLTKRCFELEKPKTRKQKRKLKRDTSELEGRAVTEQGIALINGGWEEWRGDMSREEVIEQFPECYEGINKKEFFLRQHAGLIVHEILHCLGLFHPRTFLPRLVDEDRNLLPNALSYEAPKLLGKHHPTGRILIPVQTKLLHSYLVGNKTYQAFRDSDYRLTNYLRNMAIANKLKFECGELTSTDRTIIRRRR